MASNYGKGLRQNGGQLTQKALRVPFPLQWGRYLRGGDRSFQVVWRTDLEVNLERTQHYYTDLLALYLPRMIISIQYSMMLLACVGVAKTMPPPRSPREKLQLVAILSLRVNSLSLQERNMLFVDRPVK